MGTMLLAGTPGSGEGCTTRHSGGLQVSDCPERWNLERPEAVAAVHAAYAAAGARWLQTNTFGATAPRLARCGLEAQVAEVNAAAVRAAREGAGPVPVLASIGPTGSPDPEVWRFAYAEQVKALAGVDGFVVETIVRLDEGLAAVRAAVAAGSGPVLASWTPARGGELLDGTGLEEAAVSFMESGAAAVGVNCGEGPESLLGPARRLVALGLCPVLARPNAGLPRIEKETGPVYTLTAQEFARAADEFFAAGVRLFGGCCGTTPEHIAAAARLASNA
jgi:methionine synthase I (cobalamin-dependent)